MIDVVLQFFYVNKDQQHEKMPAVPRIGDTMTVQSQHYIVADVRWHLFKAMNEDQRATAVIITLEKK